MSNQTTTSSNTTVVLNAIFSLLVQHLNKLYNNIENEQTFPKLLLDYLENTLNAKKFKEIHVEFRQLRGNGLSNREIVASFKRFYDNYYTFQLRCFYDDNPSDGYETTKTFSYFYNKGYLGLPSYLNTKMFGTANRDQRLVDLVSAMQEEDRYYENYRRNRHK